MSAYHRVRPRTESATSSQPPSKIYANVTLLSHFGLRSLTGLFPSLPSYKNFVCIFHMRWLINTRSQLSLDSKLTVYKAILRPIWTYGIELWGCSKPSNTKILQTFQSKMIRMISSAPWYVSNQNSHNDFEIPYVTEVIRINTNKYKNRSTVHSDQLIRTLFNPSVDRRLKRLWPEDLAQ